MHSSIVYARKMIFEACPTSMYCEKTSIENFHNNIRHCNHIKNLKNIDEIEFFSRDGSLLLGSIEYFEDKSPYVIMKKDAIARTIICDINEESKSREEFNEILRNKYLDIYKKGQTGLATSLYIASEDSDKSLDSLQLSYILFKETSKYENA